MSSNSESDPTRGRWLATTSAALPGVLLIAVTILLVLCFALADAGHRSLQALLVPDPLAAAGTLGLIGGAEGVTISIVIVVVVLGIQMTATRYSPRIIGQFTRNPWNALVLSVSLASILYTFLIRSEIKPNYVPMWSVGAAEVLGLVNFGILLPYVGYIFEVMRAETLVAGLRRRAGRDLRQALRGGPIRRRRGEILASVAQITDIAFGSIQLGDVPVCLLTIDSLRDFLETEYLPIKRQLAAQWFQVGHGELSGASDQVLAEANRGRTWMEFSILSSFVDVVGLTPAYRREAVHAIAMATRRIGVAAIENGDPETVQLCLRFFNTYLRAALDQKVPSFASATMNEYRRMAIEALEWRPDLAVESAVHLLHYGRSFEEVGMPAILGAAAEDVADLAIEGASRDRMVTRRLAHLLVQSLGEMVPGSRPIGLNGVFKAVVKLALWALENDERELSRILIDGIAAAPADFVEPALHRMETLTSGLFWEVNERVVAFDWVEESLRGQIPRLRAAIGRAQPVRPARARGPHADDEIDLVHPAASGSSPTPTVLLSVSDPAWPTPPPPDRRRP